MISVCIATYNGEKYVHEQISSILNQIDKNDEIIISDDHSTDSTIEILKSFCDSRIKIFENNGKSGVTGNFENALSKASGDFIFLSDQDDVWFKNKVKTILNYLKTYDFVVHDCVTVGENLNIIDSSRFKTFKVKNGFWHLMYKTRFLGCCMAFKKNVLLSILPFPQRSDLIEHDLWVATVSEYYFKTALIKEPLIYYRRHGNNLSAGGFKNNKNLFMIIEKRIYRYLKVKSIKKRIVH